ncbi:MAG: hypothetical protein AMS15_08315 [Planctomycetes bacterium DG_23]|nr:MAG: hypothetical protein AMS15_08315 [Planctomycetes bacterium DG_23]
MDRAPLKEEIAGLQKRIEDLKATKPAHDKTGAYEMRIFQLEEQLDEKKIKLAKQLQRGR